jgi:hypothetical protein
MWFIINSFTFFKKHLCHLQGFENNLLVFDISILVLQHVQMSSNLGLSSRIECGYKCSLQEFG